VTIFYTLFALILMKQILVTATKYPISQRPASPTPPAVPSHAGS